MNTAQLDRPRYLPAPTAHTAPLTELQWLRQLVEHLRRVIRLSFSISTTVMLMVNIVPIVLIPNWVDSLLKRSATVTGYPDLMLLAFIAAAVLSTPFLLVQYLYPGSPYRKLATTLATYAHLAAALAWAAMALLSVGLDKGAYGIVLWVDALGNLAFAFALALSANHELLHEINRGSS